MAEDANTGQFEAYRPLMFSIAYRMLGSATEAEDIVQDAYLRYQSSDVEAIVSPKAFLSTVVTRLCLNQLESAHNQRESYIGPWLPEPVLTPVDDLSTPAQVAELHESISMAFLTLLEQLSPLERAVLLLRQVFDYEYAEIAEMLGKEEAACRQIFSRARKHLSEGRPRFKPSEEAHRQILGQFVQAATTGELDGLMQVVADDVLLWADGGGKARGAALHPLHGREAVGRFVLGSTQRAGLTLTPEFAEVNGEPSVIIRVDDGSVLLVLSISVEGEQVSEIRVIGNPDKLKWVSGHERRDE
jgi:RNA polymerase sigma-70 factor (ECF subfamily)